jgi:hypothetical protein
MKSTLIAATFLVLASGAAAVGAKSNVPHLRGTQAMFDLINGVLHGIPATGSLPPFAGCPNTATLFWEGANNGAAGLRDGSQEIAPLRGPLTPAIVCGPGLPAGMPAQGQQAEQIVVVLQSSVLAANPATGPNMSCGGVAYDGTGGAHLTPATCTEAGCVAGTYTPADERDFLRVLYFGVHGGAGTTTRNCSSDVRRALVASYRNLFQKQGPCTAGVCAGKKLKHAYRPGDAAADTDIFAAAVGLDQRFGGYNRPAHKGAQQSNGFCNAGDVGPDHTIQGIGLGFDDSVSPPTGPNWDVVVGDGDFADLDPIRTPCEDGDEVCGADGTNGLVQVIAPPAVSVELNYPLDLCDAGSVDLPPNSGPYVGYFGRCGDGSPSPVGGCVIGYKACSPQSPCHQPGGALLTSGRSYLCMQQSFPGSQGLCWLNAPQNGQECRGANNWMRNVDGTLVIDSSINPANPRQALGAFFRKHINTPGTGGTGTCREPSAGLQIGCLVGQAEPCSIGIAGREVLTGSAAEPLAIKNVVPSKPKIQNAVSADDATYATRYLLTAKLSIASIVGFGSDFNVPIDNTGNGVSGEELNLVKCLVDPARQPYYESVYGFIALPGNAPYCEDFPEYLTCTGGLRPGKKCASDADCPGAGVVADGTCSTSPACPGATGDNDACGNNASAGIPGVP